MSSDIALTGLQAAATRMAVSAHNIANVSTPKFKTLRAHNFELPTSRGTGVRVLRSDQATDLSYEMVEQVMSLRYGQANAQVVRYDVLRSRDLLDILA